MVSKEEIIVEGLRRLFIDAAFLRKICAEHGEVLVNDLFHVVVRLHVEDKLVNQSFVDVFLVERTLFDECF